MAISSFEIILFLIIIIIILFIWVKYKVYFISNFFIGGILLILLSNLDFLGFKGQIGVLPMAIITISYILLNISTLGNYLFQDKKEKYFLFPTFTFIFIIIFEVFFIDSCKFLIFKLGVIIRLFLSFFPLLAVTYYFKFLKK